VTGFACLDQASHLFGELGDRVFQFVDLAALIIRAPRESPTGAAYFSLDPISPVDDLLVDKIFDVLGEVRQQVGYRPSAQLDRMTLRVNSPPSIRMCDRCVPAIPYVF
jgi:hypothetical protein